MENGWTFQSLIDQRMVVTAYCTACAHHQNLDLEKLRDRFGPDAPAMNGDIVPKLRCAKCGSKKVEVRYAPDETKVFGMASPSGKNPYAKAKDG